MRPGRRPLLVSVGVLACAAALGGCERGPGPSASRPAGADPRAGRAAIRQYGCGNCHTIPGVTGARGIVGPPLTAWARRALIAGAVPNTPDQLMRWIQDPQSIEPGTAMPDLGVPEATARDIAAYLYTLR
jgi:cytochrome c